MYDAWWLMEDVLRDVWCDSICQMSDVRRKMFVFLSFESLTFYNSHEQLQPVPAGSHWVWLCGRQKPSTWPMVDLCHDSAKFMRAWLCSRCSIGWLVWHRRFQTWYKISLDEDSTFVHIGREDSVYDDEGCFNMIDVHPFTVMRYHSTRFGVYLTQCHWCWLAIEISIKCQCLYLHNPRAPCLSVHRSIRPQTLYWPLSYFGWKWHWNSASYLVLD